MTLTLQLVGHYIGGLDLHLVSEAGQVVLWD